MRPRTLVVLLLLPALLCACGDDQDESPSPAPNHESPAPGAQPGPAGVAPLAPKEPGNALGGLQEGSLPEAWTVAGGRWRVYESESLGMRVLQDAQRPEDAFNVVLMPAEAQLADVRVTVTVDPVTGKLDRGGGPVWRARDGADYYVARWNPLETNLRVYKVVGGVRTQLGGTDVEAKEGPHVIVVEMRGDAIRATLDGKHPVEVHDATFAGPGRLGLWTKSDARTGFSRLHVEPLEAR
jgi:hypothetical protein